MCFFSTLSPVSSTAWQGLTGIPEHFAFKIAHGGELEASPGQMRACCYSGIEKWDPCPIATAFVTSGPKQQAQGLRAPTAGARRLLQGALHCWDLGQPRKPLSPLPFWLSLPSAALCQEPGKAEMGRPLVPSWCWPLAQQHQRDLTGWEAGRPGPHACLLVWWDSWASVSLSTL